MMAPIPPDRAHSDPDRWTAAYGQIATAFLSATTFIHMTISVEEAMELISQPEDAITFFREQAIRNKAALEKGLMPEGRVYDWGTKFPARDLDGIELGR